MPRRSWPPGLLQALRWVRLGLRRRRLPPPRRRAVRLTNPGGPADREVPPVRRLPALRLRPGILSRCSLMVQPYRRQSADLGDPVPADLAWGAVGSPWIQQAALP